jgi:hypothetical protein
MEVEMKRFYKILLIGLFLTGGFLTACSQNESLNCSSGGEICIQTVIASTFPKGQAVPLAITITSKKDFDKIGVSLSVPGEKNVVDAPTWEPFITATYFDQGDASWAFPIKAGQTITFQRTLHFPPHEGIFTVVVTADNVGRTVSAIDHFDVLFNSNGGNVVRSGTPFPPYTFHSTDLLYGPGTSAPIPTNLILVPYNQTPVPQATLTPALPAVPGATRISPLVATATRTLPAYPPPSPSPSPSRTVVSSPYP